MENDETAVSRFPAMFEHQVSLRSGKLSGSDADIDAFADAVVESLSGDGVAKHALGSVASADLESRTVEVLMTVEAHSHSDLLHKVGLITELLEQQVPSASPRSTQTFETTEDPRLLAA